MASHRFILAPEQLRQAPVLIAGPDWQHFRTLRLKPGEQVLLADGQGCEYRAQVTFVGSRHAELKLLEESGRHPESPLAVTLYQGFARGGKLDWVIEKATELGLQRFVPVVTSRSQMKPAPAENRREPHEDSHRLARWRELARQAARQSGRTRVPEVAPPCGFHESLEGLQPGVLGILLYEAARPDASWRARLSGRPRPDAVAVWVGPEGGFTADEVAAAEARGAVVAGLGPRILRSETAGVVAVALAMSHWGDLLGSGVA